MKGKPSRTTLALVFFSLILILSIAGLYSMSLIFRPSYLISAHKINYVPERQVLLENPDKLTLEAINNGHSSVFYSYDGTSFDEIYYKAHDDFGFKPFYFEYNNSYYDIGLAVADSFPPAGLVLSLLLLIVASIVAVVMIIYRAIKYAKIE